MPLLTTARRPRPGDEEEVRQLAQRLGLGFWPRQGRSLPALLSDPMLAGLETLGEALIVAAREPASREWRLAAYPLDGRPPFLFHPNMAKRRVQSLRQGEKDPMVEAMALTPGQSVLDCTLGLAADAIVASFVVGPTGLVTGWDSSAAIALVVAWGLAHYQLPGRSSLPDLVAAMRRIRVQQRDHRLGLPQLPSESVDVVYFDPMFRQPILASQPLGRLRPLADMRPLDLDSLQQAYRVARRRVVVKERAGGDELTRWQPPARLQGKNSPVAFGIWPKRPGSPGDRPHEAR